MAEASWDDLQLFHVVAEAGGLSGAAARTGISAPTIGRRMLTLERTLGRSLFLRSQRGYELAHDGRELLKRVQRMREVARDITDWHSEAFALPFVTIATDCWLSPLIADNLGELRTRGDQFRVCCSSEGASGDLTFRAADVVVVAKRPESGNVAVLPTVDMAYAVYRPKAAGTEDLPWISIGTAAATEPRDRYVFENFEGAIMTWTEDRHLLPRLVMSGAGKAVLPVWVGDSLLELEREGDVIEPLTHPLFIVAHDDDRHRREVRLVIERMAKFLKGNAARLVGRTGDDRAGIQ
ncbi:LysR family transcriptional regulator [Martelella sp. FOR1707]